MSNRVKIAVVWERGPVEGWVEVTHGRLESLRAVRGGCADSSRFQFPEAASARLELSLAECCLEAGAHTTRVRIASDRSPITFFARDVNARTPIWVPEYGVAVTPASDRRSYAAIRRAVRSRRLLSGLERLAREPEETYENAAMHTRDMTCPIWLGLGRDIRLFRLGVEELYGYWGWLQPAYHSFPAKLPETQDREYALHFVLGPGSSCRSRIVRMLDEGVLPILQAIQYEDDVEYRLTAFATLETGPLSQAAVRGTDWRVAYAFTGGNMYTEDDRRRLAAEIEAETRGREEEVVCCLRVEAVNTSRVPSYAWFKAMRMSPTGLHAFDGERGFSTIGLDRVYAVHILDGRPMPQEEMAILVQPGASVRLDMIVPHQPVSTERALRLSSMNIDKHLAACRAFWRTKLVSGAQVRVPERTIDERIRAGLLHLDINTLGQESDGPTLATVGWYAPIGSESAPMIQFYDSMGWHKLAERCLDFFFERQRPDGFIQNFGGYQLETGPVLWSAGEHFRYTRDAAWVRRVTPHVLAACDYLLGWRERNKRDELRGKGYGLLDGKVADPDDFFHSFMLNALSYVGLQRAAEMLAASDPEQSRRILTEAQAYREDIRRAYYESLARSPVVPLGNGAWAPAPPPWTEYPGPVSLYAEGGTWFSHGAFGTRDSLIGPLYLVIGEVLEPFEPGTTFMLHTHHELFTVRNAGLSQPYYPRHDFIHLKRGEIKPFLATYYNQLAALADRQTYTFWEHYWHASQHKTHEEGWFLMETRWMLWMEEGQTLTLLRAVPRRWLQPGAGIRLTNVASYFGPFSLDVTCSARSIEATMRSLTDRKPQSVSIRLPHPNNRRPRRVIGGRYDHKTETVHVDPFGEELGVKLIF